MTFRSWDIQQLPRLTNLIGVGLIAGEKIRTRRPPASAARTDWPPPDRHRPEFNFDKYQSRFLKETIPYFLLIKDGFSAKQRRKSVELYLCAGRVFNDMLLKIWKEGKTQYTAKSWTHHFFLWGVCSNHPIGKRTISFLFKKLKCHYF